MPRSREALPGSRFPFGNAKPLGTEMRVYDGVFSFPRQPVPRWLRNSKNLDIYSLSRIPNVPSLKGGALPGKRAPWVGKIVGRECPRLTAPLSVAGLRRRALLDAAGVIERHAIPAGRVAQGS
jgi:hypothetical protein